MSQRVDSQYSRSQCTLYLKIIRKSPPLVGRQIYCPVADTSQALGPDFLLDYVTRRSEKLG